MIVYTVIQSHWRTSRDTCHPTSWHNPRQGPHLNHAGAGFAQGGCQRIDRRPCGDDIVDDGDIQSLQIAADPEGAAHVPIPLVSGQQGLRPGVRVPVNTASDQRQAGIRSHRARNLEGLIEAALDQTPAVQRHGHQSVHLLRQTTTFKNLNQQESQRPPHWSGRAKLHGVDMPVQRRFIEKRRRHFPDAPTFLGKGAQAYRPLQATTVAGISDPTDQRAAVHAQTRFSRPATALAELRQQACQKARYELPADVQLTDPGFRSNTPA